MELYKTVYFISDEMENDEVKKAILYIEKQYSLHVRMLKLMKLFFSSEEDVVYALFIRYGA